MLSIILLVNGSGILLFFLYHLVRLVRRPKYYHDYNQDFFMLLPVASILIAMGLYIHSL